MPCRKENYIFLEQSVTVDSKEVDALVTKIGEALQLHNNSATQQTMSRLHGLTTTTTTTSSSSNNNNSSSSNGKQSNNSNTASAYKRNGCCIRLRSGRKATRASPYNIPGSSDQEWDHFATWNRKGLDGTGNEDNPTSSSRNSSYLGTSLKKRSDDSSFHPSRNAISRSRSTDIVRHDPASGQESVVVD